LYIVFSLGVWAAFFVLVFYTDNINTLPFNLRVTGYENVDQKLSPFVGFFQRAYTSIPAGEFLLNDAFAMSLVIISYFLFELARPTIALWFVPIYPLLIQVLGVGGISSFILLHYNIKSIGFVDQPLDIGVFHVAYVAFFALTSTTLHIAFMSLQMDTSQWCLTFMVWYVWIAIFGFVVKLFARERGDKKIIIMATRIIFGFLAAYGLAIHIYGLVQIFTHGIKTAFAGAMSAYILQFTILEGVIGFLAILISFAVLDKAWKPLAVFGIAIIVGPAAALSLYMILRNERIWNNDFELLETTSTIQWK